MSLGTPADTWPSMWSPRQGVPGSSDRLVLGTKKLDRVSGLIAELQGTLAR
jgi:hypothetical protein